MRGRRFKKLVVTRRGPSATSGNLRYYCRCDCGQVSLVAASHLRTGKTGSCGCAKTTSAARASLAAKKHGYKGRPEYAAWNSMLDRCTNPTSQRAYRNYGGRGIKVCRRWLKFENFLADMGDRPPGLTLDRKNPDGNYTKSNCRWATPKQQARNKRNTIYLTYQGVTRALRDWEDHLGFPKETLYNRLCNGWSTKRIFETPYQAHKARRNNPVAA